ncbi:hypothetical protein ACFYVC_38670 [Streptomyces tendae]|uniref:hypothetical protein n=1 Tax=Streptomyces tendae TaxID=1932 RepID=UPI0036A8F577
MSLIYRRRGDAAHLLDGASALLVLNSGSLPTAAVGREVGYVRRLLDLAAYFVVVEGELA